MSTTPQPAATFDDLAARYVAAWNETEPAARRRAVDALWSEDGSYTDPLAAAVGRAEIDAVIGAVQQQFAGMTFRLVGPVDGHHNQARFAWELGPEGAEALVVGFDVVLTDQEGRLTQVLGFLDRVPTA